MDQAKFDLDLANIDLKKAKSQVNSVGNYVDAANAAARSYEHASNLSDEVSRKIDAQAQGVKDITISQFVLQESSSTSVRWAVVGLILGVALTLIATRRNRKRASDISRESSLPVRDLELEEIERKLDLLTSEKVFATKSSPPKRKTKKKADRKSTRLNSSH